MASYGSIEGMAAGLQAAIELSDWVAAHRHIERLKSIVLDGVARNDPESIQQVGSALHSTGQALELARGLAMKVDDASIAWQLRADAATALLAQRIRPKYDAAASLEHDVGELLLNALSESATPLTNREIAERTNKDPATVSRTLKRLKNAKKIQQWKAGPKVYNRICSPWEKLDLDSENDQVALTANMYEISFDQTIIDNEGDHDWYSQVSYMTNSEVPSKDKSEQLFESIAA